MFFSGFVPIDVLSVAIEIIGLIVDLTNQHSEVQDMGLFHSTMTGLCDVLVRLRHGAKPVAFDRKTNG